MRGRWGAVGGEKGSRTKVGADLRAEEAKQNGLAESRLEEEGGEPERKGNKQVEQEEEEAAGQLPWGSQQCPALTSLLL